MLQRLGEAIMAVCPIIELGGREGAISIVFFDDVTPDQRAAAHAAVERFDWSQAAHEAWLDAQEPFLKNVKDLAQQAITDIDAYLAIADTATNAQVRAEVKAIDQRQRRIIQGLVRVIQRTWR